MQKRKIHRYEILEQIGEGGMGVVYKARDPRIDRIVAIKTIKFEKADDPLEVDEKKKRLFREAKTSGKLFHQNIVTILDVDEYEDFSYIVMEYIEGITLARMLRGGRPLEQDLAVYIIAQVCDALHYAHGVSIIHRDIKPSNVMVLGQNQVKVADFGLAKMLTSSSANITRAGGVVGTPFYMAPEQIRGEPSTPQVDIFAVGVALYECLTGAKPFIGDSISTIIYKILNEEPVCIREFNRNLSPVLDTIISRALHKNPAQRYQTAEEMSKDLNRFSIDERAIRDRTASLGSNTPISIPELQGNATADLNRMVPSDEETRISDTTPYEQMRAMTQAQTQMIDEDSSSKQEASSQVIQYAPRSRMPYVFSIASAVFAILFMIFYPDIKSFYQDLTGKEKIPQNIEMPTPITEATVLPTPLTTPEDDILAAQNASPTMSNEDSVKGVFYSINTVPAGAIITLNGEVVGESPLDNKMVKEGTYLVEARLSGYQPYSENLTVEGSPENPTLLNVTLVPLVAQVTFQTNPSGATVTLNDQNIGKTPLTKKGLEGTNYTYTMVRQNYKPVSQSFELKPGEKKRISRDLEPAGFGSLSINAVPWANIDIDGDSSYQETPKLIPQMRSGIHTITLRHPDYPVYKTTVEIPVGNNVKVYFDFKENYHGILQVNADPFGDVYIDGKKEGETPISKSLSAGKHEVRITHKGKKDYVETVEIEPGKTVNVQANFR